MYVCRYWLDPYSLFLIEVILMQFAELRRWQDYRNPGSMGKQYFLGLESVLGGSGDPSYPGNITACQQASWLLVTASCVPASQSACDVCCCLCLPF